MDIFLSPLPPAPPGHKYDDEDDGDDDDEKVLPSKAIRVAQGTHFPNAWCRMRLQDAHDQRDFPSVLRLAQEIITLDGEDVNLTSSKTYRGTLSEKDVELTAIVLHHLDRDNPQHIWLLHILFLDAINNDCHAFQEQWNSHPISGSDTHDMSPKVRTGSSHNLV